MKQKPNFLKVNKNYKHISRLDLIKKERWSKLPLSRIIEALSLLLQILKG
jgi:hypothetical protein